MSYLKISFVLLSLLSGMMAKAQNPIFISKGNIEFEYKVNMYTQLQGEDNEAFKDLVKKNMPQFKVSYFNLRFRDGKTLYQPGRENPDNDNIWFDQNVANDNIIFSDLEKKQSVAQKKVFEKLFLIKDSIRNIQWKITSEIKTIAGFQCRRANAIIMDSIYVVAFYSDDILTSGGPESFSGLPGMILGVSLPHEHVSWFATKLVTEYIKDSDLKEPGKGKVITIAALMDNLRESLKDWGKSANRYVKQIML